MKNIKHALLEIILDHCKSTTASPVWWFPFKLAFTNAQRQDIKKGRNWIYLGTAAIVRNKDSGSFELQNLINDY